MQKALIAEGDLRVRELLLALCKSKRYEVETGANSGEVLQKIQHEHINVCFLDFALPGMNIVDLVSVINELRKNIYIVITADQPDYALEIKVRSKNIFYFAHKPINPDEIEKILQAVTELIKEKENVIEDDVVVADEKLFKVIENVKIRNSVDISKDSGEKYNEVRKQEEGKIEYVIGKVHNEVFKIDTSINRNVLNLGRTISDSVAKISLLKTEILQKTLIRQIKFVDDSINGVLSKITNIISQLK